MKTNPKIEDAMLKRGFVTLKNAAEKTGMSTSSVYRLVEDGTIAHEVAAGVKYASIASLVAHLGEEAAKGLGLIPSEAPASKAG